MEKNEIINYIDKLKEFEKSLSENEDNDSTFLNDLNDILRKLDGDFRETNLNSSSDLKIRVKRLHSDAVIPSYSKDGDAGMDLTITSIISNTTFQVTYGFGIAVEIPKGYVGLIFPRSSVRNYEIILSNCVGVIDSGYRGEIQGTFNKSNGLDSFKYKIGDRAAQILIIPYPSVKFIESDTLTDTERSDGGFGSTGK